MLRKIWHDPVWSKVIAGAILAVAASVSAWLKVSVPGWLAVLLVGCAASAGFLAEKLIKRSRGSALKRMPPVAIRRISLASSDDPTKHGWIITRDNGAENGTVRFQLTSSPERGRFTFIEADPGVRFDYALTQRDFVADSFEVDYRPENGTVFYVRISVSGAIASPDQHWIKYRIGSGKPKRFGHNEWAVFVQPSPAPGGWLNLRCDLREHFHRTFGQEGLELDHISGFRIRGAMSIAAITLYSSVSVPDA